MMSDMKDFDLLCKEALQQIKEDEDRIRIKGSSGWNEYDVTARFKDWDGGMNRLRMFLQAAQDNGLIARFRMIGDGSYWNKSIWVSFDRTDE